MSAISKASKAIALVAAVLVGTTQLAPAWADNGDRKLLYQTHVDAAHITWEGGKTLESSDLSNSLFVRVVDGADPVPADTVIIRLGPDADPQGVEVSRMKVPADPSFSFLGKPGDILWHGPQHLYDGHVPVWVGLGAGAFPPAVEDALQTNTMDVELLKTEGPGNFWIFNTWAGKARLVLSSVDKAYSKIYSTPGNHGHFNWAFTAPGRYDMTFQAHVMTRDGRKIESKPTVVSWLVGSDEQVGLPAGTTKGRSIKVPIEDQPTPGVTKPDPNKPAKPKNPTVGQKCATVGGGNKTLKISWADGDTSVAPPKPGISLLDGDKEIEEGSVIQVPTVTKTTVPNNPVLNKYLPAGSKAFRLGAPPSKYGSAISLDTTGIDFAPLLESWMDSQMDYESPVGAGTMVAMAGDQVLTDSVDPEAVHYAMTSGNKPLEFWFSEPGFYAIELAPSVRRKNRLASGEKAQNYTFYQLRFAVGDNEIRQTCGGQPDFSSVELSASEPAVIPAGKQVLAEGHTDIFHVFVKDGKLGLNIREDITGQHVQRNSGDVVLHVKEAAITNIPQDFPGEPAGYLLPMVRKDGLLWPGWDTNDVAKAGYGKVQLEISNVQGPGTIYLYEDGQFGGFEPVLDAKKTELPGTITAPMPLHAHTNWVFSAPGEYSFDVVAKAFSASNGDRAANSEPLVSQKQHYSWVVGKAKQAQPEQPSAGQPAVNQPVAPINPAKPVKPASRPAPAAALVRNNLTSVIIPRPQVPQTVEAPATMQSPASQPAPTLTPSVQPQFQETAAQPAQQTKHSVSGIILLIVLTVSGIGMAIGGVLLILRRP